MRAAVIGLGKMGVSHAAILNTIPGVETVGLCDLDGRAEAVARGVGLEAPFFRTADALLTEARPEIAFLCLPSSANLAMSRECLRRGIHLFVEKPLANTVANAEAMLRAASATTGLCLAVGFMGASIATFRRAREIVASGEIGDVRRLVGVAEQSLVSAPQKQWLFRRRDSGGGAGMSIGTHCLLQMLRLGGAINSVSRSELRFTSGNDVEDTGAVDLSFASGASGRLRFDWSAKDRPSMRIAVEVSGSSGSVRVSDSEIEIGRAGVIERLHVSQLSDDAAFYLGGDGYASEDAAFIRAATEGGAPAVGWPEALDVQRVIDAIYRSADMRQPTAVA